MEYTRFKNGIEADEIKSASITSTSITAGKIKAPDIATYKPNSDTIKPLPIADRSSVVAIAASESGKSVTLELPVGTSCIVANVGADAFTLKNVTADAGLSLPAGRAALVVVTGSSGTSVITPLYTPAS